MNPWSALVTAIESGFSAAGEALGGHPAAGVFALTLVVRLALVPVMLPLARRGREWREVHRRIRPEIKRITRENRQDPARMQAELKALHHRNGIGQIDKAGLLGAVIQLPILIAFFQAVIHFSADTPLASGGLIPGLAAGAMSYLSTVVGDASTPKPAAWAAGVLPVAIAAWLGRGVALYLAAFYLGSVGQALLMKRRSRSGRRMRAAGEREPAPTPVPE